MKVICIFQRPSEKSVQDRQAYMHVWIRNSKISDGKPPLWSHNYVTHSTTLFSGAVVIVHGIYY